MTAVEWLIDKILQTNHLKAIFEDEITQAKEMEKQRYAEIMSEIDIVLSVLETTDNIYCVEKLKKIRNL